LGLTAEQILKSILGIRSLLFIHAVAGSAFTTASVDKVEKI